MPSKKPTTNSLKVETKTTKKKATATKKAPAKKAAKKPATKVVKVQDEISIKKIGKSVAMATIEGKVYKLSLKNPTVLEQYDDIASKTLRYNKKNSDTLKAEILNYFNPSGIEAEKEAMKEKGIKKLIKSEEKKAEKTSAEKKKTKAELINDLASEELTEADAAVLQELINKTKKTEQKVIPTATQGVRRGGEH